MSEGTFRLATLLISLAIFSHHAKRDDVEGQGDDEQDQAQRKSRQRLGRIELLIARQKLDDLGRDRGNRSKGIGGHARGKTGGRSEEHTSELQSLMRISYAVFCLKKKN